MFDIKIFQEKVNKKYPREKLKVLSYNGANGACEIQCEDCEKVYSFKQGQNALAKTKPCLCHSCCDARKSLNAFKRKLSYYSQDDLTVVSYGRNTSSPCDIKCNRCGTMWHFEKASSCFKKTRPFFCKNCFPFKNEQIQTTRNKFQLWIENSPDWKLSQDISNVRSKDNIKCLCLKCGRYNFKPMYDYMRGRGCFCSCNTEKKTTELFRQELDADYDLLTPYKGAYPKVLLCHTSCGFKYSVSPHNYLSGKRCPKCSRKESKGEKKVREWLTQRQIKYKQEYPVRLNGHLLRYDFYLPELDIYIEYQGEQHFYPLPFFGGESRFKKQLEYDATKREYAKGKLIEIAYNENIPQTLLKALKFNDHPAKE